MHNNSKEGDTRQTETAELGDKVEALADGDESKEFWSSSINALTPIRGRATSRSNLGSNDTLRVTPGRRTRRQPIPSTREERSKELLQLYHREYPWAKDAADDDPFPMLVNAMSDDQLLKGIRIGRSRRYSLSEVIGYRFPRTIGRP